MSNKQSLSLKSLVAKVKKPGYNASDSEHEQYKKEMGENGENIVAYFLNKWEASYLHIEQMEGTKPKWLHVIGGKRIDFVVFQNDSTIIFIDAKYQSNASKSIQIERKEIEEIRETLNKLNSMGFNVEFLFIFPLGGCALNKFLAATLDEFDENNENCSECSGLFHLSNMTTFDAFESTEGQENQ